MKPNYRMRFGAMTMLVFAFLLLLPGVANAQSSRDLARYLSAQDNAIGGLNIDELRKSKYFKQALEWAKGSPGVQELLGFLSDAGMDVSTDLSAVVIGVAQINPDAKPGSDALTIALAGKIDAEKVLKALADKKIELQPTKDGKLTIYSREGVDLVFPQKGVLWMSTGSSDYRKGALLALKTEKKTLQDTPYFKSIIDGVDTQRGLWILVEPTASQSGGIAEQAGPQAKSAAISVGIVNGFKLDILMELTEEKDAEAAAAEISAQARQMSTNPMVTMFGAGPLLNNLKVSHKGKRLTGQTTMTAADFDKLIALGAQLIENQLNAQGPAAMPGAQPFNLGAPNTAAPAPAPRPGTPAAPKKGAKADFN